MTFPRPSSSDLAGWTEAFSQRRAQLIEVIERIECELVPYEAADAYSFEAGLTACDLRRVLRCRDRWPHWREEKFIPPLMVEKLLARDGFYGPEQRENQIRFDER